MNIRLLSAGVLVYAALGGAVPAAAQETDDPFETARFRFGPVRFTPALELTSLGRDTNVFNEADDPKSDTTAAFGPSVRLWMRPGGSRLSARVGGQYLFFKEYDNQRAWNTADRRALGVPALAAHAVRRRQLHQYPRAPGLRDRRARPPPRRCGRGRHEVPALGENGLRRQRPPRPRRVRREPGVSRHRAGRRAQPDRGGGPRPVPLCADAADHLRGRQRGGQRPVRDRSRPRCRQRPRDAGVRAEPARADLGTGIRRLPAVRTSQRRPAGVPRRRRRRQRHLRPQRHPLRGQG